ncbi:MAG: hypothetical protein LBG06_05650 [Deltaproteobacteria bacterium]|nr:hypothetical protein [Deltaproteobacteria bacterium]
MIDTETTWGDEVMSIGLVIADSGRFTPIEWKYYVLTPFKNHGGMYAHALYANGAMPDLECSRERAVGDLARLLSAHYVSELFAYNAAFDKRHLPELAHLAWYDIMKLAANRNHNPKIPRYADCHGTGRLKRGFGVESVYRMLSGEHAYCEQHNALADALDELRIMKMLNHETGRYVRV